MKACQAAISKVLAKTEGKAFRENKWGLRHVRAWTANPTDGNTMGGALVTMIEAWADYADFHAERYESKLGDEGILGPAWLLLGKGMLQLLNGELGSYDAGTLESTIVEIAKAAGFESISAYD
jgi:hypothetical protein